MMRAMLPLHPPTPPDLTGRSVLIASGQSDPIVPHEDVKELAAILKESGATVQHLWLPAGHNLTREEIEAGKTWLKTI